MKKRQYLVLMFLIISFASFGQNNLDIKNAYISLDYSKSFILPHHESFYYLIKGYPSSVDVNISKQTLGNKIWHRLYNLPYVGFGYNFIDFGNKKELGNAHSVYPFIQLPLWNKSKFSSSIKFAAGVSWVSKHFDVHDNVYNIAIGAHLNAYLNISTNLEYQLNRKLNLYTSLSFAHFSNGGTQHPNRGLNVIGIKSGVKYFLKRTAISGNKIDTLAQFKKKNEFTIIYSGGLKTLEPARRKKYYVSSLSFNFERRLSHKTAFGLGIDMFKDNSKEDYISYRQIIQSGEEPVYKDRFYAGTHLSYDLIFGKTSFTVQMGAYFWQRAKSYQAIYNRFGVKYRFSEHWLANLTLKTFWAAADFAEWGVGYRF